MKTGSNDNERRLRETAQLAIEQAEGDRLEAQTIFAAMVSAKAHLLLTLFENVFKTRVAVYLRGVAEAGGGQPCVDTHDPGAAAGPTPAQRAGAVEVMVRQSAALWDTFMVNGQPIKLLTREEILGSAERDDLHGHFKRALAEPLPPGGRPVDYLKPEDAEKAWAWALRKTGQG